MHTDAKEAAPCDCAIAPATMTGLDQKMHNVRIASRALPVRETDIEDDDTDVDDNELDNRRDAWGKPLSERKRRHIGILAMYIKANAEKEDARAKKAGRDPRVLVDDEMSLNDLMKRKTDKKIIENPREYQMELFERAKTRNTIAVLDTGSGKTLIAALLIRWIFDQELEHRKAGGSNRIMFFVVGSVALTFQQHGMLSCNLDHKLAQLYGDQNVDQFSTERWAAIFKENMGVVCTAEVLSQCLTRSFINIKDINLLIFDEAHHAKKEHSFSQIMNNHYRKAAPNQRPRIFGMTASPVDAKTDVVVAAQSLESTLDAQIATTRDTSLLRHNVSRPQESVLQYRKPPSPLQITPLTAALKTIFGEAEFFEDFFKKALLFTSELGEWCCDRYWELCFREDAGEKVENQYQRVVKKKGMIKTREQQDIEIALIERARQLIKVHDLPPPMPNIGHNLSGKVRKLCEFLATRFETKSLSRCIVFVKHRNMAFLLSDLCKRVGAAHMRAAPMVGTRRSEPGEIPFSLGLQIRTLAKFEKGDLNCIFATTIAEEGLDVADCNIIVRFDLYDTMIQYVQSRGRARHKNSVYMHMLEAGNMEHEQRLAMVRHSEQKMREFCEALPDDRLLRGLEDDLNKPGYKDKRMSHREKDTGAVLDYGSSLVVLHHFIDCLPVDTGVVVHPTFIMQNAGTGFVCEVILPAPSPVRSFVGKICSRKAMAKRSAAFMACIKLRQLSLLDSHFMPTWLKQLPTMRNAQLALSENDKSGYPILAKPRIWKQSWNRSVDKLYITILNLTTPGACGRPHVPLALLTRTKMPHVPNFPIFPVPGVQTEAKCTLLSEELCPASFLEMGISDDGHTKWRQSITKLTQFTMCIFHDVFAKSYEYDEGLMSYWLAPVPGGILENPELRATDAIDWETLDFVCSNLDGLTWSADKPPAQYQDKYIIDRYTGSRRFCTERLALEYLASDPRPEGVRLAKSMKKWAHTILDYSYSVTGKYRKDTMAGFNQKQAVWKAYATSQKRNLLEPWTEKDSKDEKGIEQKSLAYICLEPLMISSIPVKVAAMAWNLPALIFRIESHLIAIDAANILGLRIDSMLALEALTKDSDNSHAHNAEQVNKQKGIGNNYERLEFLGDCFLKMATSISLYVLNAGDDEFESHVKRMLMICNKNLFTNAKALKIYEYVRVESFTRRVWYPEGLKLTKGTGYKPGSIPQPVVIEAEEKRLSDKTIADVYEAMIGAALLSHTNPRSFDMAVKAVTVTVDNDDHRFEKWDDYYAAYKMPIYQTMSAMASHEVLAQSASEKHAYLFRWPRLLVSAFNHPSYPTAWSGVPNYQRLEFLGDSLLDMVCVNYLYSRFPDKDPQWLTEHKMAMASNKFLGSLCVKLGFHTHLRHNQPTLSAQIKAYVEDIEDSIALDSSRIDAWTTVLKDPPKCLPDVVEAYLGAIFVDSKFDFTQIERFFDAHILWHFSDMTVYDTFANAHPVTALAHMLEETYTCHDFRVMGELVPQMPGETSPQKVCSVVFIHDSIIADDWSTSTKYGKVRAAQRARSVIEGLSPSEYRAKFGCDCKTKLDKGELTTIPLEENVGSAI